jgi:UDP-N-acetylmuramyl tripeptide synthase
MCKNATELMSLVDEMTASAASMREGPQNYDNFIRTRDLLKEKVKIIFDREQALCKAIKQLNTLIQ